MTVTWRSLGAKPGTKCYCFPGTAEPSGGSVRLVSQPAQRLSTANNVFHLATCARLIILNGLHVLCQGLIRL